MYVMNLGSPAEFGPENVPSMRTTQTPASAPAPTPVSDGCAGHRQSCANGFLQWLAQNPQVSSCMNTLVNAGAYTNLCCAAATGDIKPADVLSVWQKRVAQMCPPPASPPTQQQIPPAKPSPTPTSTPYSTPTTPGPGGNGQPSGDTGKVPVTQSKSALKTWGPIVGIGLLAAVGLTLARQGKSKKKRARR